MSGPFQASPLRPDDLAGRKVTVMGLGLFGGGRGLTEALCRWGAQVTVTDLADEKKLAPSLAALGGLPVRFVLGSHRTEDFLEADLVFVNPAVPRDAPLVNLCRERGIPLETEMNLFFKLFPGKICGVTGSNGKTTTTRLIGEIARREMPRTLVGGNLGVSLLPDAGSALPTDWAVLELSSFQLEDLSSLSRRPEVSVVTNVSPNHLDRHGSYRRYLECKKVILEQPPSEGWAILSGNDPVVRSWGAAPGRRTAYFGRATTILPGAPGVWVLSDGQVVVRGIAGASGGGSEPSVIFRRSDVQLRGDFNLVNAAGAAAAGLAIGISPGAILLGVRAFPPVPHRLELVHGEGGVEFFNDSIATTPESTICALETLGPRVILIAGGYDKGSSFRDLGRVIARRTRAVILIGKTANAIQKAIAAADRSLPVFLETTLADAVRRARGLAESGDRVVLSPACASYGMFVNFEERGEQFTRLVRGQPAL